MRRRLAPLVGALVVAAAACGGGGDVSETYDWFVKVSPSGVSVECLEREEALWCREQGEP